MDIVPITVWREARGEGIEGMRAVAWVIENRANDARRRWPSDPEHICLEPKQFSCWNDTDPERSLYPFVTDEQFEQAGMVWVNLHAMPDPTGGATFYRNVAVAGPFPAGYEVTAVIGKHTFAREP